jgi:deferrochelatase/peroxidase EfeB
MTRGLPAAEDAPTPDAPAGDSGDVAGNTASALTITFGFGGTLFSKNGTDRFGIAAKRPEALADLPKFNGDQLVAERSNGDICVQACANDPQVAFHAVRQLARIAGDTAGMRWVQTGFISQPNPKETPRNLMGFKDGTASPLVCPHARAHASAASCSPQTVAATVWAEGPDWMKNGSYLVARRIRIALEHWDKTDVAFQEQVIGRNKRTGAPLGQKDEFDAIDLNAVDKDGNPVIPDNSHIRLATSASNDGAQVLRRGYSYNEGINFTAERWPPWRQGMEYDAGLFFIAYQHDPRTGFSKIFEKMAKMDALNQFSTHVASGLFACPGGVREGEYIGQKLFEPS